jgi:ribose transport system substrate-binding protein
MFSSESCRKMIVAATRAPIITGMRRRWILAAILGWAAVAGAAGCGREGSSAPDGHAKRPVIAVIPKGTTHEYWKGVHAGALKAGEELGVDILWQGPVKEDDREEQIKVVDMIRDRAVSGILLAPLDDKALRGPVANAVRAGIPVVAFDSKLDSTDHLSLVETDNYASGRLAGDHMATLLGGKGRVIMLRLHEGSASTTERERGFLDAVRAAPGIVVVSSNQYGGATVESGFKASENLLTAFRAAAGGVDGIFCPNESTTFGMLRALQNADLAGRIRFVGFDSSEKLLQALRDGHLDAIVVQDPYNMGYLGVKTLMRAIRGERVERHIDTGATLVTRDNMDRPELQRRLHPGR